MKRPNILFILADDLGWKDLGAGGSTFYESPNIDRIDREAQHAEYLETDWQPNEDWWGSQVTID